MGTYHHKSKIGRIPTSAKDPIEKSHLFNDLLVVAEELIEELLEFQHDANKFDKYKPTRQERISYINQHKQNLFKRIHHFLSSYQQFEITRNLEEKNHFSTYFQRYLDPFLRLSLGASTTSNKTSFFSFINFFYKDQYTDQTTLETTLQRYIIESDFGRSHHYRKAFFLNQLKNSVKTPKQKINVSNFGCGSALEMLEFISYDPKSCQCNFHCIDKDPKALHYLNQHIARLQEQRKITIFDYQMDIVSLRSNQSLLLENSDFTYASGLFDFLDDDDVTKILTVMLSLLSPNGTCLFSCYSGIENITTLFKLIGPITLYPRSATELITLCKPFEEDFHISFVTPDDTLSASMINFVKMTKKTEVSS